MNAQQFDIFDYMYDTFYLPSGRPVRLIEMFAGIGTQRMAFEKLGVPYEVIAIVEVDKFALLSYASIHTNYLEVRDTYFDDCELTKEEMVKTLQDKNVGFNFMTGKNSITERNNIEIVRDYYLADKLSKNLGDVSIVKGVDLPKDIDMLTYSFPCTDLSKAGQQKGLDDTRSGLVYQVFRIVEELVAIGNAPKTLVMENVVDLIQVKFIKEFQEMQIDLEHMKFSNYVHVMNAKDYGVAQNRDRVFMVSIFGEYNYVKPRPFKLEKRLKDYLEKEVDESYYLSDKQVGQITKWQSYQNPIEDAKFLDSEYTQTITAKSNTSMNASMVLLKEATKKGYTEAYEGDGVYIDRPHQKRGVVQDGMIQTLKTSGSDVGVVVSDLKREYCNTLIKEGYVEEYDMIRHSYTNDRLSKDMNRKENESGISATLTTGPDTLGLVEPQVVGSYDYGSSENFMQGKDRLEPNANISRAIITSPNVGAAEQVINNLRIRKLTPRECWRLMGIDDECFYKAQQVTSNAQLYKQAGNAIVVGVFAELIKPMIKENKNETK